MTKHRTTRELRSRMFYSEFTIPKGTEVALTTPDQCPTGRYWYVVDPNCIPEAHENAILRHDLQHRYVFVPADAVGEGYKP